MSEGTRTPDRLDHNQELYQLSYAHREGDLIYQRGYAPRDACRSRFAVPAATAVGGETDATVTDEQRRRLAAVGAERREPPGPWVLSALAPVC